MHLPPQGESFHSPLWVERNAETAVFISYDVEAVAVAVQSLRSAPITAATVYPFAMCGRFTLSAPTERLADEFDIPNPPAFPPRYIIAPTQLIAAVALKPGGEHRGIVRVRWRMVPAWADDPSSAPRLFNARAESVAFKFGECFRERRCYEWPVSGASLGSGSMPTPVATARQNSGGPWTVIANELYGLYSCSSSHSRLPPANPSHEQPPSRAGSV
jgi:hypothetical protein